MSVAGRVGNACVGVGCGGEHECGCVVGGEHECGCVVGGGVCGCVRHVFANGSGCDSENGALCVDSGIATYVLT